MSVQPYLKWKSNRYYIFWVYACNLRYPACNAHAPYCRLWHAGLYSILPHYLISGTIFEKALLNVKWVFWFSLKLLSEIFLILRRTGWDIIKNVYWASAKVPLFLSDSNLLKPTGHVMHQQFNIQKFVGSAHTVFMCFVFMWEQTATCATYSINWLVFITEMESVYCAVRPGSLNKAVCASSLKG